jgi:light-regulated signal transduction histidine kinase (bacteriophytochrome)
LPYEPVREDPVTTTTSASLATLQARFLSVISHELRTPLTTIASFTESLDVDDLAPAERSLALTAVRRNTERMLALVDDLMVVSRLQTGDLPLTPVALDPAEALREAVDRLDLTASVAAVGATVLTGDRQRLRELFYAVIGTVACSAADRSATVTATTGPSSWTLTVTARQAEELTDELLMAGMLAIPEPPYRRRSTALWMLLADAIASRHGGSVDLTFDPAAGAGAAVRLPLTIPTD